MKRIIFLIILSSLAGPFAFAQVQVRGTVFDDNKEPLIGAVVLLKSAANNYNAVAGLDGSFSWQNVPSGTYSLEINFIGFKPYLESIEVSNTPARINVVMEEDSQVLGEVVIMGAANRGSDAEARKLEQMAKNTINVVSAKSIELSPDITVANVVQRVSGLSIERNASGDPQYAIVRGMDKRYNYTLVNGVKIPSPDNRNRYVPLDIFPAQMLERLEVAKSLTPDMEGDAIGGSVNLVMKSAPDEFEINADFQLGYNAIHFNRPFYSYDRSTENRLSPGERFGRRYEATMDDFSTRNLLINPINPLPDIFGGLTIGDRFMGGKLGVMFGASVQNSFRGADRDWYKIDVDPLGTGRPSLSSYQERQTSIQQFRMGLHSKVDYQVNRNHSLSLYLADFTLNDFEVREMISSDRDISPDNINATYLFQTRVRSTYSGIRNATLQGKHNLMGGQLLMDWSALASRADFDRPDNAIFSRNGGVENGIEMPQNIERRNPRRWEKHFDQDFTLHLNFLYNLDFVNLPSAYVKFGGMFRDKERGALFNRYRFDPNPSFQVQGVDWDDFTDVRWELLNPSGTLGHALNYNAFEQIGAYYLMTHLEVGKVDFNVGARVEHTNQGYVSRTTNQFEIPELNQIYTDFLPNFSMKYKPKSDVNLRGSYYKAINRPGYFEIVDGISDEDDEFPFKGNPDVTRAIADNFDIRYEYFPRANEQFLLGAFYKKIEDPIELLLIRQTSLTTGPRNLTPTNSGTALNWGIEMDFSKFFNKFGIRANYTFTNSSLTTIKSERVRENPDDESSQLILREASQTRPLQGQADHIGNLSLLYKNQTTGTDIQLAAVYTGERIEIVSPWLDLDIWSRPFTQLDFSYEQRLGNWVVFLKVNNLLNSPYELFVKKPRKTEQLDFPLQDSPGETIVQREQFWQSFRVGVRFKFNSI
ncbi:TonB-dependent receptor domain-containing protein [Cecembia lonarensis]|uniref:Outer membrane receptor for ferrienterochelin and colicins n=1 Tax=Cecembia lonarensis (strain CCUG 58316 / KCTC 22772 / LW9) TaxID=1225176 RepID=K1L483_CECL9|nr:TonB-dependent receptor [Cecembia lonarensis]EKB51215.1 Outer membrane receptor for ferrienterochelin and colicins [Cecembia lonarensis LW9]